MLRAATDRARRNLIGRAPLRLLVDNSVLAHGRIFSSYWFDTRPAQWGLQAINTGHTGPNLTYSPEADQRICSQLRYLPGIAYLAKRDLISLLTSFELKNEQMHQPAGRFSEYGYFDHNLFSDTRMACIDCHEVDTFDWREKPQDRLRRCTDQPFRGIVDLVGEKNNVDAWHIHTAETHALDYFLHIDFSLAEEVRKNRTKLPIVDLKTDIALPSELADIIGIDPIDIRLVPPMPCD